MRSISAKIRLHRILDGGDLMDYIKRTLEQKILDINEDYVNIGKIGLKLTFILLLVKHLA